MGIVRFGLGIVAASGWALIEVTPENSVTALSSWLSKAGMQTAALWVRGPTADSMLTYVPWGLLVIVLFCLVWPPLQWGHTKFYGRRPLLSAPAGAVPALSVGLTPDWPIRDLFFHIDPELLDGSNDRWENVGRDIIDRFSTGQLAAWGREIPQGETRRKPLASINPAYWQHAGFSYWFLKNDKESPCDTYGDRRLAVSDYADLQVNRQQAMSIWPEKATLSLRGAALRLYEETDATLYGAALRRESASENDALDIIAERLLNCPQATGVRPGAKSRETISRGQKLYLHPAGGAKILRDANRVPSTKFTDVEISSDYLLSLIQKIKAEQSV